MSLDLNEIRQEIDAIDRQIVACFEQRMNIVLKVAAYKAENNMPILDTAREAQLIASNKERLHNKEYADALECVLQELMRVSREMQAELLQNKIKQ